MRLFSYFHLMQGYPKVYLLTLKEIFLLQISLILMVVLQP